MPGAISAGSGIIAGARPAHWAAAFAFVICMASPKETLTNADCRMPRAANGFTQFPDR